MWKNKIHSRADGRPQNRRYIFHILAFRKSKRFFRKIRRSFKIPGQFTKHNSGL